MPMSSILSIAHRGARGYEPENTLRGFQAALALGADGIELDVHLTLDGIPVVIHDATVDRTTAGSGQVRDMTFEQISRLALSPDTAVPRLQDVLDLIPADRLMNIELKVAEAADPVCTLIEEYVHKRGFTYKSFIVSSFEWPALQQIRNLNREIPVGVLTATDLDLAIGFAGFIKAETIHPYFHLINKESVLAMQSSGLRVFTWTVNREEDIDLVRAMAVDAIITDYPDRI